MAAQQYCKSTQQDIKRDYPHILVADLCPVCDVKVGFHDNLLLLAQQQSSEGTIDSALFSHIFISSTRLY
jgi:hypothetical protein